MKWFCLFNIHDYEYHDAVYENDLTEKLVIYKEPEKRICKLCGKTQENKVVLLGLNPLEYVDDWVTVKNN